jgi:Na+/H+-dicarboxylate symporter
MLAVDALPDVFATLGNVTADLTVTSVVARQSRRDAATDAPRAPEAADGP